MSIPEKPIFKLTNNNEPTDVDPEVSKDEKDNLNTPVTTSLAELLGKVQANDPNKK